MAPKSTDDASCKYASVFSQHDWSAIDAAAIRSGSDKLRVIAFSCQDGAVTFR